MSDLSLGRGFSAPRAVSIPRSTEKRSWLRGMDPLLIIAVLGLCLGGCLAVYAATRNALVAQHIDPHYYLTRDLENLAIGVAVAVVLRLVSVPLLRALAPILHGAACLLLLAVLSPLGSDINGAHAWFSFGSFQVEPSEFVKLTSILLGASLLAERRDNETEPTTRSVLLVFGAIGVPLLLILAEPALGIGLVVAAGVPMLLALAGVRGRWIAGMVLGAVIAATLALSLHLLKPYQEARFTAFTHPNQRLTSNGYNLLQSEVAIGSGQLTGQGFLKGTQTNGRFVPSQQTDFIFTVVAEESGLVGSAGLLLLFAVVFWRGLSIAARAPDAFGRIVAGSIVWWFALQFFINIGMTVGLAPVTGVPLPFVSYGGSALFADLAAVGILLAVARDSSSAFATPL